MSVRALITDPKNGSVASVDNWDKQYPNSLVVATREYDHYTNQLKFFTNDTYGSDMNKNFASVGTYDNIHNGTDNVYWTASSVLGTWVFNSTAQAHTGTKSIDGTATGPNNVMQLYSTVYDNGNSFSSLSGWIYVSKWNPVSDYVSVYGWDTSTASMKGSSVNLSSYINYTSYNVWQKFVIPTTSLGLTGVSFNAFRFGVTAKNSTTAPDFYLDDLLLTSTSGTVGTYTVTPDLNTWLYIKSINLVIADNYDTTRLNATMPSYPYNSYFGVTPDSGMAYKRYQYGDVIFSMQLKNFGDWLSAQNASIGAELFDGTNSFVRITTVADSEYLLKSENDDKLEIVLSDDFSSLGLLKVSVGCKELYRGTDRRIY